MALLSGDEQRIIFGQLCNVLEPRLAVYFSSASRELWEQTQALRLQMRTDHEAATALCLKVEIQSCKELREAKWVSWSYRGLSTADLTTLGTLGSVLPRLRFLNLHCTGIGDAGLVALAPGLRRLPALEVLLLRSNSFGDQGLAALVAPLPLLAGALPPQPTGVLAKLKGLDIHSTEVTDAGGASLAAAIDSGALPALENVSLGGQHLCRETGAVKAFASSASRAAVYEALAKIAVNLDFHREYASLDTLWYAGTGLSDSIRREFGLPVLP